MGWRAAREESLGVLAVLPVLWAEGSYGANG